MRLRFHRRAVDDVVAISEHIRRDSPTAARAVARRIRSATQRLTEYPFSGRAGHEPGTRELAVARTPFIVIYRVIEASPSFVEIIAVFHGARDRESGASASVIRDRLR